MRITKLQQRLCDIFQEGIVVCEKPFERIAKSVNATEREVLENIKALEKAGIIRRIGPIINYNALGRASTLVTASVPSGKLKKVAKAINSLNNVSHNYLRKHHFNLWFTLQGSSINEIEATLEKLSRRLKVKFHGLPVINCFKLDVKFYLGGKRKVFAVVKQVKVFRHVRLSAKQKLILSRLKNGLEITSRPFDVFESKAFLSDLRILLKKGVIRRIAAIVDYRKLGFNANVLFACEVPKTRIRKCGRRLACFDIVSHCYHRKTFIGWPYNLFAMMHARTIGEINSVIKQFTQTEKTKSFALLPTVAELKKKPVDIVV